jgi:hypothetical protein
MTTDARPLADEAPTEPTSAGTVAIPLYVHPDGGAPIEIGRAAVPVTLWTDAGRPGEIQVALAPGLEITAGNIIVERPAPAAPTTADSPLRPITAPECAEMAAAVLRTAERSAGAVPDTARALATVADSWRQLGIALAQHSGLSRPTDQR